MYKIIDKLYIASYFDVQQFLDEGGKAAIVSIGDFKDPGWGLFLGGIGDFDWRGFKAAIPKGVEYIKKHSGEKTIVHCLAGVNRSSSLVIAYLILKKGMPFARALALVEHKNPKADPTKPLLNVLKSL